jgi:hypothetical protein
LSSEKLFLWKIIFVDSGAFFYILDASTEEMTMKIRKLLQKAVDEGYRIVVYYGCETDYIGYEPSKAMEAITACDEMEVAIQREDGNIGAWRQVGWALIINDPSPEICDCSGWIDKNC